jgi:hypothetical protein
MLTYCIVERHFHTSEMAALLSLGKETVSIKAININR